MSNWKNDYLAEAGVPRWVRRDMPVSIEQSDASETVSESATSEPSTVEPSSAEPSIAESAVPVQSTPTQASQPQLLVSALIEHSNPQFIIVLPKDSELMQVKPLWLQLQKAWKAWTGDEFAASCYRLDGNGQAHLAELLDGTQALRKTVLAGVQASIDNSIQAENLTFDSAINKRQWWTTLQMLLKSVRH